MSQRQPASTLFQSDLRARVMHFAGGSIKRGVGHPRSQAYDHCFNYFASTPRPTADLEKSCAVLSSYLASWGMYRGSTYLFRETNSSHFVDLIQYIEKFGPSLRAIDVDSYDAEAIDRIRQAYDAIKESVLPGGQTALTLCTKIMIAVFGCVPAYDTYFIRGMTRVFKGTPRASFWQLSSRSLELLAEFYSANRRTIDGLARTSKSFKFGETSPSGLPLTKAKILDMYGFDLGYHPSA